MANQMIILIIFIVCYIAFSWLIAAYITNRLIGSAPATGIKLGSTAMFVVLFFIFAPTAVILRNFGIENRLTDTMLWVGYLGLGFVSFVITFLVIRDMSWAIVFLVCRIKERCSERNKSRLGRLMPDTRRRRFLVNSLNMGIMTASGVLTTYGIPRARQLPDIKTVQVPIPDLPEDLVRFKIVQLTDIHVSATLRRPFVERVVAAVNTLSADVVVFTGDLADGSVARLTPDVEPLAKIKSTFGNFFVTGNHEYYSGAKSWVNKVRDLGFTVLLNEHQIITKKKGKVLLAGVTDYSAGRIMPSHASNPQKAMAGAPPSHVKILLAHQPRSFRAAALAGFDLQISGHTHGGQFFPWNYLVILNQPYVSGLHQHENTWIYVSRGTGYWGPPIRLGASSEITVLELVAAKKSNTTS